MTLDLATRSQTANQLLADADLQGRYMRLRSEDKASYAWYH